MSASISSHSLSQSTTSVSRPLNVLRAATLTSPPDNFSALFSITGTCFLGGGIISCLISARRFVCDFAGERAGFACLVGLPRVVLRRRGLRMTCVASWRRLGDVGMSGIGGRLTVFSDGPSRLYCGGGKDAHAGAVWYLNNSGRLALYQYIHETMVLALLQRSSRR
jgi:hypothetical protein